MSLLVKCLLLLLLFVFYFCIWSLFLPVVQNLVSFLVLQSSRWGREREREMVA